MELIHGGDIESFRQKYNEEPLDFSANISPLGLPKGVEKAIVDSLSFADKYPDPLNRNLTLAIANHENIKNDYIICGNGAADLIFRIVYAITPKKALILAPTFAEYEQALRCTECKIEYYNLQYENRFNITEDVLDYIETGIDIMFICQPNNPTGRTCDMDLLKRILDKCKEKGVLLVVDECFVDFLDNPLEYTLKDLLETYDNLFILKAFTKLYAMAGIRLGYGFTSNENLMERMLLCAQPWSVSSIAQCAGIAALQEAEYVVELKALVKKERAWLKSQLLDLEIEVIGGEANFIFFRTSVKNLKEKLSRLGVMIRSCENYQGLSDEYYRIAVRAHEENKKFIKILKVVLNAEGEN